MLRGLAWAGKETADKPPSGSAASARANLRRSMGVSSSIFLLSLQPAETNMPGMPRRPFAMVPLPGARSEKPRRSGLTMIVDAGMPLGQQADLMALAGDY